MKKILLILTMMFIVGCYYEPTRASYRVNYNSGYSTTYKTQTPAISSKEDFVFTDQYGVLRHYYIGSRYYKTYYPEVKGRQTEATIVSKCDVDIFEGPVNWFTQCVFDTTSYCPEQYEHYRIFRTIYIEKNNLTEYVGSDSQTIRNVILRRIKNGQFNFKENNLKPNCETGDVFNNFGRHEVFSMYCMTSMYVRTFHINEFGLETNRKDYHNLSAGTYCTDYFSNNKLF